MQPLRFCIVTPTLNRPEFLDETIRSVVSQQGNFEIDYLIQDGGSDSELLRILANWRKHVESEAFQPKCHAVRFDYRIEPDRGMYEAINRGFSGRVGDVMAWINSDDYYLPNAFQAVSSVLQQFAQVEWLVGQAACFNEHGTVIHVEQRPGAYSQALIRGGYYRADVRGFRYLPQDAMFWRRGLWDRTGPLNEHLGLAADFKLWQKFAEHAELVKLCALTGGYRMHGNQLTGDPDAYVRELGPPPAFPALHSMCFRMSAHRSTIARLLTSRAAAFSSRVLFGVPYADLFGPSVSWSAERRSWHLSRSPIIP